MSYTYRICTYTYRIRIGTYIQNSHMYTRTEFAQHTQIEFIHHTQIARYLPPLNRIKSLHCRRGRAFIGVRKETRSNTHNNLRSVRAFRPSRDTQIALLSTHTHSQKLLKKQLQHTTLPRALTMSSNRPTHTHSAAQWQRPHACVTHGQRAFQDQPFFQHQHFFSFYVLL